MQTWVVVNQAGVGVDTFQADQDYIDNYKQKVVDPEHITTPPWWADGVTFVDVTGMSPQPSARWTLANGTWTAPVLTPQDQASKAELDAEIKRNTSDDKFIGAMRTKINTGVTLTEAERDQLAVIQAERGAIVTATTPVV